ncbi:MAG: hypothetical protein PHF86_15305 [Candidatus Nanoarchaeia archaeon]|nr:hypothetical protein [Candidatus Nanoarchaeia archaeon]
MKYSQFIQFNKLLEFNNMNLNTWLINFTNLNEAEGDPTDTLDTKKGNILTKRGRLRNSLNGHAKKLMDNINKEVADKFLKPIYDLKVQVYKKMAELGKGKQPKDIVIALKGDLQNIQKIQAKQLAQIEKYAQTSIDNYTKKIETTIQKKGLKETTKVDLQTYWGLLSTQIIMNLLQKIAIQDDKLINDTIKDPAIIKSAKIINKAVNKDLSSKTEELKKKSDEKKTAIKASDEKTTTEEKSSEEVKSE